MYIYILLLILCVCVYVLNGYVYNENTYIISDVDQKKYLIRGGKHKSMNSLKQSANMLAEINKRINKLIESIQYKETDDYSKNYINHLIKNYNFEKLSEAAYDPRYTTYTINKDEIHMCLKTRDNNEKLYDINLLMYIVLHELAHMCNYDIYNNPIQGHGEEFKKIFAFLIKEAVLINIYKYENYYINPQEYCGMYITTSIM